MLPNAPLPMFYFLLVVRMASFEGGLGFAHILPLALFASSKINNITTTAVYPLSNLVASLCVCAVEPLCIENYRAGMTLIAFKTSLFLRGGLRPLPLMDLSATSYQFSEIFGLLVCNLNVFRKFPTPLRHQKFLTVF